MSRTLGLVVALILISSEMAPHVLAGAGASASDSMMTDGSVRVIWQLIRSRSSSTVAGTVTETYQAEWVIRQKTPTVIEIRSGANVVDASLSPVEASPPDLAAPVSVSQEVGPLTLSRQDLVKLLGIEQELHQDPKLWQGSAPTALTILKAAPKGRALDQVFRHADDDGAIVIKLMARLASKS